MKRVLSRFVTSVMVVATLSAALVQPATARPRSWFLPPLSVSCAVGDGKPETFTGEMELNHAAVQSGVIVVGGALTGECGVLLVNSLFRADVQSIDATCSEARVLLANTRVGGATINFSDQPVRVAAADVGKGGLCPLAKAGSLKAKAKALDKILSAQG